MRVEILGCQCKSNQIIWNLTTQLIAGFFYSSTLFIVISLYCILTSLYFLSSAQQYAKKASVFLHTEELRHPPTERTKERTRVNPRMGTSWARRAGVQRETMVLIYLYTRKAFLNQITIFLFIFDPLYMIKIYIRRKCHLREPPSEKPTKTEIGIPTTFLWYE